MQKLRNIKETILDKSLFIYKLLDYEYLDRNNVWQKTHRVILDKGDGCAVLLYHLKKETIILIKQFRMSPYLSSGNKELIEVCAGVLEKNETAEDCIRREAIEETGYQVNRIESVFFSYMSPGVLTERLHLFIAEYKDEDKISIGGGLAHENEEIDIIEIPFKQSLNWIKSGKICDAKTIMLIQYLALTKFTYIK